MLESPIYDPRSATLTRTIIHVHIDEVRCIGCQECIVRCPEGALELDSESWTARANESLCVGCRQCERTCPYGVIEVEGPVLVPERRVPQAARRHVQMEKEPLAETRPGFASWSEALEEAERCLGCPDPTCVLGCPTHNDIPGFIKAIRSQDLTEAHAILRRTTVLPDICSRVCDQSSQCEGACSWNLAGSKPVAIGLLERFITDQQPVPPVAVAPPPRSALRVAIVGSGPAGLAAAWRLVEGGAEVTIFEKDHEPGGVLAWGIPSFTLPDTAMQRPYEALTVAGVTIKLDTLVDGAMLEQMARTYDAVLLAHGASEPFALRVPGSDLNGVEDATSFLRRGKTALQLGRRLADVGPGVRILVIGAGNTAMDVARTARRIGAQVLAVDWADRRFAAVREDELVEAEHEGVTVRFSRSVSRLEGERGRVHEAWLVPTVQESARERPQPQSSGTEKVPVDLVVTATGYRVVDIFGAMEHPNLPLNRTALRPRVPQRRWLASGLQSRWSPVADLSLEREVLVEQAARPMAGNVFVVGDALAGPSTVVAAMSQAQAAAQEILALEPKVRA